MNIYRVMPFISKLRICEYYCCVENYLTATEACKYNNRQASQEITEGLTDQNEMLKSHGLLNQSKKLSKKQGENRVG